VRVVRLIVREIAYRKINFLLSLAGLVAAVALFVFFFTGGEASQRETTRLMRDLGLNLRIIPGRTDPVQFALSGVSDHTMPEKTVHDLASRPGLSYAHLLPMLRKRITWRQGEVLLVGLLPEVAPVDQRQPSMSIEVKEGTVQIGSAVAAREGMHKGDRVELLGKPFTVASCLRESGTERDSTVFAHLHDVQSLLGVPGRINEIQALDCRCAANGREPIDILREQLASVLPDATVIQLRDIAVGRERQRRMVEEYLAIAAPLMLVVCAAWVGLLAMINVRERRQEIGLLRALGYRSGTVGALFLGKATAIGVLGAVIGFAAGTGAALVAGPDVFTVTGKAIRPLYGLLGWSVLLAAALSMIAAAIPAAMAITADPAATLRED
jgi:putative ABC transport system permease protein